MVQPVVQHGAQPGVEPPKQPLAQSRVQPEVQPEEPPVVQSILQPAAANVSSVDSREFWDPDDDIFSWKTCTQAQCEGLDSESLSFSSFVDLSPKSSAESKAMPSKNSDPLGPQARFRYHPENVSLGSGITDNIEETLSENHGPPSLDARMSVRSFHVDTSH